MRTTAICVRVMLCALAAIVSAEAMAQFRIVKPNQIDSVANPATVAKGVMAIDDDGKISFGEIKEVSGVWSRTIKWQNRGDEPLVITRLTSSCSCLRADTDRRAVGGGEWGSITLRYSPERRGGEISQRVFVYTNLSEREPTAVVTLTGKVKPSADRSADYPYAKGELLLLRDTIIAERGEQVRVACMNGGKGVLRLRHNALLSEQGLTMHTEPQVLQPYEEGDMVITVSPTIAKSGVVRMVIDGLSVPPRQRTVVVRIKD